MIDSLKCINQNDPCKFSGVIYESDFNSYRSLTQIANNILKDECFDRQCDRNNKLRTLYGSFI